MNKVEIKKLQKEVYNLVVDRMPYDQIKKELVGKGYPEKYVEAAVEIEKQGLYVSVNRYLNKKGGKELPKFISKRKPEFIIMVVYIIFVLTMLYYVIYLINCGFMDLECAINKITILFSIGIPASAFFLFLLSFLRIRANDLELIILLISPIVNILFIYFVGYFIRRSK